MHRTGNQNYYEILDVHTDATQEQIERAYRLTKKALSEGSLAVYSLFDADETRPMLKKIEEAYIVLSSNESKKRYDEDVLGVRRTPGSGGKFESSSPVARDYRSIREGVELREKVESGRDGDAISRVEKKVRMKSPVAKSVGLEFVADDVMEEEIKKATSFTGKFLKKIREYRRVSINDISRVTKINSDYIRAIEDFNLSALPPRVYLVGFLKQYANILKLDSSRVVNSYLGLVEESKKG